MWAFAMHGDDMRFDARCRRGWSLALLALVAAGCTPPELTVGEQALVRRCLELAFENEEDPACAPVTASLQQRYLEAHPEFHEELMARRKAFVEERIAEDQRRRDELRACVAAREAGQADASACEKFLPHEIERMLRDGKLRRCAKAQVDEMADAQEQCADLTEREIEEEVQAERARRVRQ